MRYLTVAEVLDLHRRVVNQSGGSHGEIDEQERVILSVAAGAMNRDELTSWLQRHMQRVG